jgi:hypothetical protein
MVIDSYSFFEKRYFFLKKTNKKLMDISSGCEIGIADVVVCGFCC